MLHLDVAFDCGFAFLLRKTPSCCASNAVARHGLVRLSKLVRINWDTKSRAPQICEYGEKQITVYCSIVKNGDDISYSIQNSKAVLSATVQWEISSLSRLAQRRRSFVFSASLLQQYRIQRIHPAVDTNARIYFFRYSWHRADLLWTQHKPPVATFQLYFCTLCYCTLFPCGMYTFRRYCIKSTSKLEQHLFL